MKRPVRSFLLRTGALPGAEGQWLGSEEKPSDADHHGRPQGVAMMVECVTEHATDKMRAGARFVKRHSRAVGNQPVTG
jgi:hypothetical protein